MDALPGTIVREWPDGGSSRVPNWVYTDPRDLRARTATASSARATGCMSASKPKSPIPATSSAASSAIARSSLSAAAMARSTCWSTAARIAACRSAPPVAVRRRSSSAPITNGPMTSPATCSACRSAAAIAARAACPPISARRNTGCERLAVTASARRGVRQLRRAERVAGDLSRRAHAGLFRPRVRRPRPGGARLHAAAHSRATGS